MTTWERPNRADKNGAFIVPPIASPHAPSLVPHRTPHHPPNRPHATTRRPASHTATHIATPHYTAHTTTTTLRPSATPQRPDAIRHARRDEHEQSNISNENRRDDTGTRTDKNGATGQHRHETPDNTERRGETRSGTRSETPTPTRERQSTRHERDANTRRRDKTNDGTEIRHCRLNTKGKEKRHVDGSRHHRLTNRQDELTKTAR